MEERMKMQNPRDGDELGEVVDNVGDLGVESSKELFLLMCCRSGRHRRRPAPGTTRLAAHPPSLPLCCEKPGLREANRLESVKPITRPEQLKIQLVVGYKYELCTVILSNLNLNLVKNRNNFVVLLFISKIGTVFVYVGFIIPKTRACLLEDHRATGAEF